MTMRGGRGGPGFGRGGGEAGFGRGGGDVGFGRGGDVGFGRGGGDVGFGRDVGAGYNRGGGEAGFNRGGGEAGFSRGSGGGNAEANTFTARSESFSHQENLPQQPRVPPSGPRGSFAAPAAPTALRQSSNAGAPPAFPRAQIVDAPTGPKAGRRPTLEPTAVLNKPQIHPAIADLPKILDGGLKAEPLADRSKLGKLEEEAERLRRQIEDRETRRRKNMREWDRMTRDTEAAALRSELAEQSLKLHNGEAESQAAF